MKNERRTAISWVEAEKITLRGYAVEDLIGRLSFAEGIFLILCGEIPSAESARLFEAVLVSVIDHGVKPPSTIAAVTAANSGAPLNAAAAAGILAINKHHGGAVEDAMLAISAAVLRQDEGSLSPIEAAREIVRQHQIDGRRVSGFGHRFHGVDPRTARLFDVAANSDLAGRFVEQAKYIEQVLLEETGRNLPINADGAIAACLLELHFPSKLANGVFMIARIAGLVAHAVEEQERNAPMRTVDVEQYLYDGERNRVPVK